MTLILLIFSFLLLFLIHIIFLKYNILIENKRLAIQPHKKFSLDKDIRTTVSGGIFFSIFLFLTIKINISLFYYLSIIFIIGLLSDLKLLNSPIYRIIFQIIATFLFIYFNQDFNIETRIIFIDNLLNNIVCIFLNYLFQKYDFEYDNYFVYLVILIFLFCIFNFYSRSFLGDGGVYVLSAFIGERAIFISSLSKEISPYYIINMFWYPAFENLFSIIRKFIHNRSPGAPDNLHLHHHLFSYVKNKNFFRKQYLQSSFSGIIINLFVLITLILATLNISSTKYQMIILFINITSYLIIYICLKNKFFK